MCSEVRWWLRKAWSQRYITLSGLVLKGTSCVQGTRPSVFKVKNIFKLLWAQVQKSLKHSSLSRTQKQMCVCTSTYQCRWVHIHVYFCICEWSGEGEYNMFYILSASKMSGSHTNSNKLLYDSVPHGLVCLNLNHGNDRWDSATGVFNSKFSGSRWSDFDQRSIREITTSVLFCCFTMLYPFRSSWGFLACKMCKIIVSSWTISRQRACARVNIQQMLCNLFCIKTVFLTSDRESTETEGGRGSGQEQTACLQRAKEWVNLFLNLEKYSISFTDTIYILCHFFLLCVRVYVAECPPLGMESHKVQSDQLSSSSMSQYHLAPQRGRLNMQVCINQCQMVLVWTCTYTTASLTYNQLPWNKYELLWQPLFYIF